MIDELGKKILESVFMSLNFEKEIIYSWIYSFFFNPKLKKEYG